jgi:hypothetical protein
MRVTTALTAATAVETATVGTSVSTSKAGAYSIVPAPKAQMLAVIMVVVVYF